MPIGRPPLPLEIRFWRRVNKNGPPPPAEHLGNCWLWTLKPLPDGYGRLQEGGRNVRAHRISWQLHYGEVPNDLMVLHRCDTPLCVRPTHLFLGTHKDNMRDRDERGRTAKGDRSGARLHPETRPRGDAHPRRRNPSLILKGDAHPRRRHPEWWAQAAPRKLTTTKVAEIRSRAAAGEPRKLLAVEFGVTTSTIDHVVTERTWR